MKKITIFALAFLVLCTGIWYFFFHDKIDRSKYELQFYQSSELNNYQKFLLTAIQRSIDCKTLKNNLTKKDFWSIDKIEEKYEQFAELMIMKFASVDDGKILISDILRSNSVKNQREDVYNLLREEFKRYENREPVAEAFNHEIWSNQKLEVLYTDLQEYLCHMNTAYSCAPGFPDEKRPPRGLDDLDYDIVEFVIFFEISYIETLEDAKKLSKELLMDGSKFDTCLAESLAEICDYDGRSAINKLTDKITDEIDDLLPEEEANCCETPDTELP